MAEAAFDLAAQDYDRQFSASVTGRAQRRLVWAYLDAAVLDRPMRVLELNCGTGEDAARFASRDHTVLATDVSAAMVGVARGKLAGQTQSSARQMAVEQLGGLGEGRAFDLVFSNFGGLNCVSPKEMAQLGARLARLVPVGGRAVLVVMPRLCLWEMAWHLAMAAPKVAFRRFRRGPIKARPSPSSPATLDVWYHAKRDYAAWMAPGFRLRQIRPIGFAVPPSAVEAAMRRFPRLLACLEAIDRRLPGWPFAMMADHLLLDFERTA